MAEKFEQLDKKLDQKLTVAEMYLNRPRKWWIYTLIVLILAVLVGLCSADSPGLSEPQPLLL